MPGNYSFSSATGAVVATGAANALIWACRWTDANRVAIIERLRVNACVTGTITTAVPYDLAAYFVRSFTVAPSTGAVVATLTGSRRSTAHDEAMLMAGIYTLDTAAIGMTSTLTSIRSASYKWTASVAGGTGSFYCEASGSGNPSLASPSKIRENGVDMTLASAVAALPAGSYWYGDGDTLGYNTVYVHLADGADPDSKDTGWIDHFVGAVFTVDASPLARISGASGTVIGTQFFGAGPSPLLDYRRGSEVVLGVNEGVVIRAPLAGPATGTFRVAVTMDWREAGNY